MFNKIKKLSNLIKEYNSTEWIKEYDSNKEKLKSLLKNSKYDIEYEDDFNAIFLHRHKLIFKINNRERIVIIIPEWWFKTEINILETIEEDIEEKYMGGVKNEN